MKSHFVGYIMLLIVLDSSNKPIEFLDPQNLSLAVKSRNYKKFSNHSETDYASAI